jgi:ADP-heptose:LPS heptosyltransferase
MSRAEQEYSAGPIAHTIVQAAQQAWFDRLAKRAPRILVVQRDNIGDLVLVTPFLAALKACLRDATLDILVNSYNAEVVARNPHIDRCWRYVKAKHRPAGQSLFAVYWNTWMLWRALRKTRYDLAIVMTGRFAKNSLRPAVASGAAHIAGFTDGSGAARRIDLGISPDHIRERHVVRRSEALLDVVVPASLRQRFWPGELPPCRVYSDPGLVDAIRTERLRVLGAGRIVIGIHVSARKVDQRLSAPKFAGLMHRLHAQTDCGFILFWAPGAAGNPLHPGDDVKAEEIRALTTTLPVFALETPVLADLIAGLGLVHLLVCSDGGAMHLAAAQNVPIVALFGNSEPDVWHPWGCRYEVLRAPSEKVEDLTIEVIFEATTRLMHNAPETMGEDPRSR